MFRSSEHGTFDKLLEKATSNLLLEPDWATILLICDLIRQKDVAPKYAIASIKKKLTHQNPHVAYYGLLVLESLVKNCGTPTHEEVATKAFMEELRELCKTTQHENVREKLLELIQTWAHAFRKVPSYRAVQDVLNIMKAEGSKFPPLIESEAMFKAEIAPEWADGECCNRCRTEFGMLNRKHHCRACGQIFCAKCSSRTTTLPNYGIEKEVRVCESCFEKHGREIGSKRITGTGDPAEALTRAGVSAQSAVAYKGGVQPNTTPLQQPKGKTEEELQEEEQLQLALAISQSEAEAKEREKGLRQSNQYYQHNASSDLKTEKSTSPRKSSLKSSAPSTSTALDNENPVDPELARYLDRDYWETRHGKEEQKTEKKVTISSSPGIDKSAVVKAEVFSNIRDMMNFQPSAPVKENRDKNEQMEEIDAFMVALRSQLEMFVNRMKSNSSRGRPIYFDNSVQTLFLNITTLHSQLLNYIQTQENWRGYYEGLQDKLNQVRDARDALDALRKEHSDRLRQIAEEAERQRQYQMAQKLQVMRQQKQQYLQYQRELALQRVQEQERQMQLRIEQQRMGMIPQPPNSYGYGPPQGYPVSGPPPDQQQQQHPQMGGVPNQHQVHYMPPGGQQVPYMPHHSPSQGQVVPSSSSQAQGQIMSPQQQQPVPYQGHFGVPVAQMLPQHMMPPGQAPQPQPQNYYPPQQQQQQMGMPSAQQNGVHNHNPEMNSIPNPNETKPAEDANIAELISFD